MRYDNITANEKCKQRLEGKTNKTGSKLRIADVIHRFSVNDKVKTIVGAKGKFYHQKRKGSHAIIIETAISLNKPCYWLKFADGHYEWYDEDEINGV